MQVDNVSKFSQAAEVLRGIPSGRLAYPGKHFYSGFPATRNLALELFFVGTGALRGCTALKELRHMPRLAGFAGRARGRIAADLGLQLDDVDELVGLAAQLIGDHRRLR